ncbi:50S ribosomal protein L11 methyltransferase [Synergistales bacterium]|nr:50S ribosomal protein L11 methyltransferase [Synergistales bacterium]
MKTLAASFRDPSGRVYSLDDGNIIRSVQKSYAPDYNYATEQNLFLSLREKGLLIDFEESKDHMVSGAWKTLSVERIPVVTYPYEWSFSQLKDAALLTLQINRDALAHGMILKDASAFNVQFTHGKPIFIDILSFERRLDDSPWVAYGQFCRHFLAPLLLMAKRDLRYGFLTRDFIDGIPLDFTSAALPRGTWLSVSTLLHIHMHSWMQGRFGDTRAIAEGKKKDTNARVSDKSLLDITDGLLSAVNAISLSHFSTEWGDYYSDTNYSTEAFKAKENLLRRILNEKKLATVLDVGANNGHFSRIASETAQLVIAPDIDPLAVEKHYRYLRDESGQKKLNIIPMIIDLTNPSPSLGWACSERSSFFERCGANLVLALALVHHLAISNNVPLPMIAEMFASLGENLLIEFVPKEDSQTRRLLTSRKDVFPSYNEAGFREAFSRYFVIEDCIPVPESERKLFVMKRN